MGDGVIDVKSHKESVTLHQLQCKGSPGVILGTGFGGSGTSSIPVLLGDEPTCCLGIVGCLVFPMGRGIWHGALHQCLLQAGHRAEP